MTSIMYMNFWTSYSFTKENESKALAELQNAVDGVNFAKLRVKTEFHELGDYKSIEIYVENYNLCDDYCTCNVKECESEKLFAQIKELDYKLDAIAQKYS